jgi:hypothetical protein
METQQNRFEEPDHLLMAIKKICVVIEKSLSRRYFTGGERPAHCLAWEPSPQRNRNQARSPIRRRISVEPIEEGHWNKDVQNKLPKGVMGMRCRFRSSKSSRIPPTVSMTCLFPLSVRAQNFVLIPRERRRGRHQPFCQGSNSNHAILVAIITFASQLLRPMLFTLPRRSRQSRIPWSR